MKRALILAVVAALPWAVAGCGEKPTVTVYKPGEYQGKRELGTRFQEPWDNDQFKGDRVAWERTIKKRNDGQNEYARATPTAN